MKASEEGILFTLHINALFAVYKKLNECNSCCWIDIKVSKVEVVGRKTIIFNKMSLEYLLMWKNMAGKKKRSSVRLFRG